MGLEYSQQNKDAIVRQFLSSGGSENPPLCPFCSEELDFKFEYLEDSAEARIRIDCSECAVGFTWMCAEPVKSWRGLHINYFLERYSADRELRCPYDDCTVTVLEFPEGSLEFRCFYCNRRGNADSSASDLINLIDS